MHTLRLPCVLIFVLAVLGAADAGDHWPCWRGPTGMGLSDEKDLPQSWGGKSNDNVAWKVPLFPSDKVRRDQNQSSPIVWGDRVIVTVSYWPEGVAEKNFPEHHVLCFAATDGKQLWDNQVEPGPWKLSDFRGGYTAPTPATDGKHVVAIFGSSVVVGLDLEGRKLWRHEIKPHHFDVALAMSPVLYKDTALVISDQSRGSKASSLICLETATGTVRWQKKRPDEDWTHSTPLLAEVDGRQQLLAATAYGPQSIDPDTGEVLWSARSTQRVGDTTTPVYKDGQVYVDSGRGGIGLAFAIGKAKPAWQIPVVPEGFSSPLLVGSHLYRLHSPAVLSCYDWATGKQLYRERLEGVDPAVSPIATADGLIYCASAGKSCVVRAGPKFEVVSRSDLGDPGRASPAVAAGRIYLKGGRYLFCVAKKSKEDSSAK